MKKRRGATEDEVRREVGEAVEEGRPEEELVSEKREEVGSRWLRRWRRLESISRKD